MSRALLRAIFAIFFLTGLVLVLIGIDIGTSNSAAMTVTVTLGGALMTSGSLSLLYSFSGTDALSLVEKMQVDAGLRAKGLRAVHLRYGNEDILNRLEGARSIDMLYNTGKNTWRNYGERIASAVRRNGCVVRLVVTNPTGALVSHKEFTDALCPGTDISAEITETQTYIDGHLTKLLGEGLNMGSIELRYFDGIPTCSLLIVDDDLLRQITYLPYSHSSDVPEFDIVRERSGALFQKYADAFERVWNESKAQLHQSFPV